MPGQARPNKKAAKIAYDVLKTPKELRGDGKTKPSQLILEEWSKEVQKSRG
jgi:hypothetical protein